MSDYSYNTAHYYDSPLYPQHVISPNVIDFLNGNIAPLVDEIKTAHYTGVSLDFSKGFNSQAEIDQYTAQQVNNVALLIKETPFLTDLSLTLNMNTSQALHIAQQMPYSNIDTFFLTSENLSSMQMPELIHTLSDAKIEYLAIDGKLDDATLGAMHFKGTSFEMLDFYNTQFSANSFATLFDNLAGSKVDDLLISDPFTLTADAAKHVDLSQTNIETLILERIQYEDNAWAQMSFKDSKVEFLSVFYSPLTPDDVHYISESLKDTTVDELLIGFYQYVPGEIAQLDLKDTNVSSLSLYTLENGLKSEIGYLNLAGTNVKSLDLAANGITDLHLESFNLKDSSVEHIDLSFNYITATGIETLKDIIKDTHVIDVTIYPFKGEPQFIINEHAIIDTKKAIRLSDVISDSSEIIGLSLEEVETASIAHHPCTCMGPVDENFDITVFQVNEIPALIVENNPLVLM